MQRRSIRPSDQRHSTTDRVGVEVCDPDRRRHSGMLNPQGSRSGISPLLSNVPLWVSRSISRWRIGSPQAPSVHAIKHSHLPPCLRFRIPKRISCRFTNDESPHCLRRARKLLCRPSSRCTSLIPDEVGKSVELTRCHGVSTSRLGVRGGPPGPTTRPSSRGRRRARGTTPVGQSLTLASARTRTGMAQRLASISRRLASYRPRLAAPLNVAFAYFPS